MNTNKQIDHLYIAIICGGGGKRLWPRSRQQAPKQFIKLFGEQTIFQKTVQRAEKLVDPSRLFIITNKDYQDEVALQAPQIPKKNVIPEPEAKNTALAIVYGVLMIKKSDPDAVIVNLWSDHFISDTDTFIDLLYRAYLEAQQGDFLVTVGVKPTRPDTGLGYIRKGPSCTTSDEPPVFKVEAFTEKPDLEKAKEYLESQNYYWNSGIYVFSVSSFFKAVAKHNPGLWANLQSLELAVNNRDQKQIEAIYHQAEDLSIDYAVAEKATNMLVIPGDFGWSDIGDWETIWEVGEKDENGNVIINESGKGDHVGIETSNCLIHLSNQLVTTLGVKDLIIVDTEDALLVASKDKVEEVKKLVNLLKEKGKIEYL